MIEEVNMAKMNHAAVFVSYHSPFYNGIAMALRGDTFGFRYFSSPIRLLYYAMVWHNNGHRIIGRHTGALEVSCMERRP